MQILTVLPKSWTVKKIQEEFGVTKHTAQRSKKIVEEQGVLSLPRPKAGHSLVVETVDVVHSFYQSDDISRVMPGMKD